MRLPRPFDFALFPLRGHGVRSVQGGDSNDDPSALLDSPTVIGYRIGLIRYILVQQSLPLLFFERPLDPPDIRLTSEEKEPQ